MFYKIIQTNINKQLLLNIASYLMLIYIILFPLSMFIQESTCIMTFICMSIYYYKYYNQSALSILEYKYILLGFILLYICGTIFSIDIQKSSRILLRITYKGLFLFLYGLEISKYKRNAPYNFFIAIIILLSYVSLDIFYESIYGYDFFLHRVSSEAPSTLAGPFSHVSYTILIYIYFPFIFTIFTFKLHKIHKLLITIPIIFLCVCSMYFVDRRGGLVALFVTTLLISFFFNIQHKKFITFIIMVIILVLIIIKFNNFISILNDDRWRIWQSVFQSYLHGNILFGSGLDTYKITSKQLSLDIKYNNISIDSPHNVYLGILHDFGIIGLSIMILLIYKQLRLFYRALSCTNKLNEKIVVLCGFASYITYLIAAIYDIDFYRPIFVGPTMLIYGIITGYALKILTRSTNE